MYKTDQGYRKGLQVAVYENTTDGSWIARHSDSGKLRYKEKVALEHPDKKIITKRLEFNEIDWKAAGYNV